ncbi:MAG: (2Fe-2S)-binding protein [Paenibacillus sp.]|jgi:ferric iron reductase protein FhuF|nr:(2Fe-2S)-binding protein [Paenibacillus sp.]
MIESLHKFNIGVEGTRRVVYSVPVSALPHGSAMEQLLEAYSPLMKALDRTAAAAYFCAQFGNVCLALQYAVSVHDVSFDVSLNNITVQLVEMEEGRYGVAFQLAHWSVQRAPEDGNERRLWLADVLSALYSGTVRPVYEAASKAAGMPLPHLWGLLPTRFNYSTEQWMLAETNDTIKETIAADYEFLIRQIEGSTFGQTRSPFDVKIRWIEDLKDPCKQMRMKNSCCMYYRTEGGRYCYSCPRIKESERAERRLEAREGEKAAVPVAAAK